ncbi:MAG: hypothetical protein GX558_03830, partial [Clostridiales bacterium]|nr:hypothetical protein [Clostridiales bacterium]
MNAKRFAARALVALGVVVALCMFFARTIQTITTTKVSVARAQQGRMEQTIRLQAKLHFPSPQPMAYPQAAKYTAVVGRVYARPGYRMAQGDVVFTLNLLDYDEKMDKLRGDYAAQAVKLAEEDIKNRKLRTKTSAQNDRYQAMLQSQADAADGRAQARALAIAAGVTLPADVAEWPSAVGGDQALRAAAQTAADLQAAAQAAIDSFFASYNDKKVRVNGALFDFLVKRAVILNEMADIEADMAALRAAQAALSNVRAPRDGYVVEVGVKEGETYDGKKAAYAMDNAEHPPVLRADAADVKRAIEKGAKAEVR